MQVLLMLQIFKTVWRMLVPRAVKWYFQIFGKVYAELQLVIYGLGLFGIREGLYKGLGACCNE
ncbi:hypothetical protein ERO13_A10G105450v2 [Gossypium hirsutum]|uniref:Uncharacterized protein n=1 Tax=Gossypium darwinii TaxID=34276 RepID=A0A5D2EY07_GOSDA|nr:hypothetical protein ERO13_A10G105450v2 [Gossypium hirsutum]TYG98533.1 hypothetical protein ES288_A10G124600v1 [Gossypium darwinii]